MSLNNFKKAFFIFLIFTGWNCSAQLGFCTGSKGEPIFFENFGSGLDFGPQLPAGATSYAYIPATPNDGQYTLYHKTNLNGSWHNSSDHTPDNTPNGVNGKSLIVNASFTPGEFFKRTVSNLCVSTTFEFTAWLMNVYKSNSPNACPGTGIPVDVTFEIWNASETVLLESGSTGQIQGTPTAIWTQYGLTFTMPSDETTVVLKMRNNGAGGCGNDLAIDDIMFRSCGDNTVISSSAGAGTSMSYCGDDPVTITLNAAVSGSTPFVLQWQVSNDNVFFNDIPGETMTVFTTPPITQTSYFRVKVARDAANLANLFCYTLSETYSVVIIPKPLAPVSGGNISICANETILPLSAIGNTGESIAWYDAPTNGNLLGTGNNFTPTSAGTYYAETFTSADCRSDTRTPVTLTFNPVTEFPDIEIILCEGTSEILNAGAAGLNYLWSTGESTQFITVNQAGIYTVSIVNSFGCVDIRTITVVAASAPIITDIEIQGTTVTILTATPGAFEYSIDNINFYPSNVFYNVQPGFNTAYVNELNQCGNDDQQFFVILIPNYFTPNNDGINDFFRVPDLEQLTGASVDIFDRYGKFLKKINPQDPLWDGKLNGKMLPSTDYWYHAVFPEQKEFFGHFTLKR